MNCDDELQILYEYSYNNPNFLMYLKQNGKTKILKKNKTHWGYLSLYYKLSNEFMRTFHTKLNWKALCIKQNMSEDLMSFLMDDLVELNDAFDTEEERAVEAIKIMALFDEPIPKP